MAVVGTDVFVAGDESSGAIARWKRQDLGFKVVIPMVRKNGTPVPLSDGNFPASDGSSPVAISIAVAARRAIRPGR
jgi:hypothetical protein